MMAANLTASEQLNSQSSCLKETQCAALLHKITNIFVLDPSNKLQLRDGGILLRGCCSSIQQVVARLVDVVWEISRTAVEQYEPYWAPATESEIVRVCHHHPLTLTL